MDKERLEELIPLYALGVLEGDELIEAKDAVTSGDPYANELYQDYLRVVDLLPYASRAHMPDPSLRLKLLEEIRGYREELIKVPREERVSILSRFRLIGFSLGGVVAACLVLFLFITNQSLKKELGNTQSQLTELRVELEEKKGEIGLLKDQYARLDAISEYLEDPGVTVVSLNNMGRHKQAGGGVLIDHDNNEALFYCLDLPEAPEGKDYQWWVNADGEHKSIGVFDVDSSGTHIIRVQKISELGNIKKFIVTVETEGGSEQPEGPPIFAREI